tara:strand:+ start:86 stop:406 length:321 start_codon:yes stop_codon:yes gene_type:complete
MPQNNALRAQKLIQDLVMFYVKENYTNYLKEKNIEIIPNNDIEKIVDRLYIERKPHLKAFIMSSMKQIMGEDYIGDLFINNILNDVFNDDEVCKNRIILEIKQFQN